ncbi:MAG: hypothetical protein GKC10_07540 [Methanosarcinales archaeon]|nr:hypothetical protein [Methanosarcinales archaeon]
MREENDERAVDLFLLTRPPGHHRADLCLRLVERSRNPRLYLAGDGIYNLLCLPAHLNGRGRVVACREDALARGLGDCREAAYPDDFYRELAREMLGDRVKMFVF